MLWRKVSVVVLFLGCSSASVLELNETTFASFPPLYDLDTWSDCQAAGDVYCMVDAALVSKQPSPLLNLMQEYSMQTLKHYNRSLIHRGVCVSHCGAPVGGSWHAAAQRCLNRTLIDYGLEAEIESVSWCSRAGGMPVTSAWSSRALAVLSTLLLAFAGLATALHALNSPVRCTDDNKYLLAFSVKRNWEILTYDRSKPRSDDRMKDLACVEGIRVVGMQCVIFSHVMLIYVYSYIDNPQFIEQMYDHFAWKAVLNSPLWIQAFFSISGFLTTYTVLISSHKRPVTLLKCLGSILNRWIRLTPLAVFALWFTMSWFPGLGTGPQWAWSVTREADDCAQRWWYHALYIHNHLPTGKFCMGHTWYLAVDMQLHIFGILLVFMFVRMRGALPAVLGTLAALAAASMLAAGLVVYFYDLMPIVAAQSPEILRTMFAGSRTLSLLYLPMWMNLPGYLGGVATAFIYHYTQVEGVKLNQKKWFNVTFHLALTLGGCVVCAGAVFLSDSAPPLWASAVYAAFDRALVTLCFNVFLLGCFSQCKSAFRSFLCWRGFHTLGRLSYAVFVAHFVVLRLCVARHTQLAHASLLSLISLLITTSVLSYLVSIPLCLLVELPALQLWKAMTDDPPRPRASVSPAPPAPHVPQAPHVPRTPAAPADVKPLDLLANVVRRPDV